MFFTWMIVVANGGLLEMIRIKLLVGLKFTDLL